MFCLHVSESPQWLDNVINMFYYKHLIKASLRSSKNVMEMLCVYWVAGRQSTRRGIGSSISSYLYWKVDENICMHASLG